MGVVISVLEEKNGFEALSISEFISKGGNAEGGGVSGRIVVSFVQISLDCLGKAKIWACKKCILEKVDVKVVMLHAIRRIGTEMQGIEMENKQHIWKGKLGFVGILKEALKIPCRNTNFIIVTFLTSFPLFCTMILHEIILQQILIEASNTVAPSLHQVLIEASYTVAQTPVDYCTYFSCYKKWTPLDTLGGLIRDVFYGFLKLGLLYLVPLHLLDLFNTIVSVDLASAIYSGEKSSMSLREIIHKLSHKTRLKGPLITSIYALFLSSLTILGLLWFAANYSIASGDIDFGCFYTFFYGMVFVVILAKYLEWSAIWNMGIVISILEERHGVLALESSAYFSRGNRRCGLFLMLFFFVWTFGLRLSCLFVGWHERGSGGLVTSAHVSLLCVGNVMKWVVCMVYYYDCKKRILEKKVDVELGGEVEAVKRDMT
ncbi:hypothetical protein HHK36_029649 [Tetracentron sinense]|uniref:Uncharacterized protein n=1 Tax=Tetracentron sinense TaxID=13715 RepID=A0A835CZX8_TETSI|nr:hypothetical protein HHK36_029649 [Tetracentron sinense]